MHKKKSEHLNIFNRYSGKTEQTNNAIRKYIIKLYFVFYFMFERYVVKTIQGFVF